MVTYRQKERLTEKLADARNESLVSVIESLVDTCQKNRQQCQKNRELLLRLVRNSASTYPDPEFGTMMMKDDDDDDLDQNLDKMREIYAFDIDEAQLLQAIDERSNNE